MMASPRKKSSSLIFAPLMKTHWDIMIMYRSCSLRIFVGIKDTTSGGRVRGQEICPTETAIWRSLGPLEYPAPCNLSHREVCFFQKWKQVYLFRRLFHNERLYCLVLLGSELWNVGWRRPWLILLLRVSLHNLAVVVRRRFSRNKFSLICFAHSNKKFQLSRI